MQRVRTGFGDGGRGNRSRILDGGRQAVSNCTFHGESICTVLLQREGTGGKVAVCIGTTGGWTRAACTHRTRPAQADCGEVRFRPYIVERDVGGRDRKSVV